eukprot:g8143.t1
MGEELPEEPAEPGGHPEQHALPLPACFGDVRWRNDQVAPVDSGMSLQQFNDFVAACRATDYWPVAAQKGHVNLYEVVEFFVKPWTRRTGCSVALRMNSAPARAEPWSGGSNAVGHKQIASSLAVALWFCAFAQYQPGSEPGDRGMVVVQTSMGDVYSRLWCVYEISEAVSSQAKVSMAYSHRALERRAGSFEDMLRTRTSGATCSSVLDEEMIRKKVEQSLGMMNELNEFTRDQLHQEIQIITEKMMGARPTQELVAIADCQLEKASEYQRSGVKQTLLCFCLAPLVILAAIGALPFIATWQRCKVQASRSRRFLGSLDLWGQNQVVLAPPPCRFFTFDMFESVVINSFKSEWVTVAGHQGNVLPGGFLLIYV